MRSTLLRSVTPFPSPDRSRLRSFLTLLCLAVVCTLLSLGLWPFHAPRNEVSWINPRHGLRFGRDATAFSSVPLHATDSRNGDAATLELWLQPNRIWDSGTLLAFYQPANHIQFLLRQFETGLSIQKMMESGSHLRKPQEIFIENAFKRSPPSYILSAPVFITLTTGAQGTSVYLGGALSANVPDFPLHASDFDNSFVLGDSPGQPDSWKGRIYGLAIYARQLDTKEVHQNYASWTRQGQPESPENQNIRALYLFDEHQGNIIRDRANSGVNLIIPERYQVIDKIALEPFWTEFSMTRSYWGAALKNIVGFIPFGICFQAYLALVRPSKRSLPLTIALGFAVSLTIEVFQIFLPNRDSGTTDLITNTLGTWVGAASYRWLMPPVARVFPRLSAFAPRS